MAAVDISWGFTGFVDGRRVKQRNEDKEGTGCQQNESGANNGHGHFAATSFFGRQHLLLGVTRRGTAASISVRAQ